MVLMLKIWLWKWITKKLLDKPDCRQRHLSMLEQVASFSPGRCGFESWATACIVCQKVGVEPPKAEPVEVFSLTSGSASDNAFGIDTLTTVLGDRERQRIFGLRDGEEVIL